MIFNLGLFYFAIIPAVLLLFQLAVVNSCCCDATWYKTAWSQLCGCNFYGCECGKWPVPVGSSPHYPVPLRDGHCVHSKKFDCTRVPLPWGQGACMCYEPMYKTNEVCGKLRLGSKIRKRRSINEVNSLPKLEFNVANCLLGKDCITSLIFLTLLTIFLFSEQ